MRYSREMLRKVFGFMLVHKTRGFSLLEVSGTIFFTSLLCSLALYLAAFVWRAGVLSTQLAEQSGMAANIERVFTDDIDRATTASFDGQAVQLVLVDGEQHRFAVNNRHQLILYMQNGGTTVLATSVFSLAAEVEKTVVTIRVTFISGKSTVVIANLLGRFVS